MFQGRGGASVSQMTSHKLQQTAVIPSQHTGLAEVDYFRVPYTPGYPALVRLGETTWREIFV